MSAHYHLNYVFKNFESTDTLREYTEKRLQKIERLLEHFANLNVTFEIVKEQKIVLMHLTASDMEIHAESKDQETFQAGIDEAVDALAHQVKKYKEKLKDHTGKKHHNLG